MKKLFVILTVVIFLMVGHIWDVCSTSAYAFDVSMAVKENIYNNVRLSNTEQVILQLEKNDAFLFFSYESIYVRVMGLSVGEYEIFGVGAGYNYKMKDTLSLYVSSGLYFTNADVHHNNGKYNEALHRYLNYRFGERLWDNYDAETDSAIGFSVGLQWEKEIENFLMRFDIGHRFLRIPVKYVGWDKGKKGDSSYGWWHSIETEDLSCAYVGLTFGFKF